MANTIDETQGLPMDAAQLGLEGTMAALRKLLAELGNLRRLTTTDMRQVVKSIGEDRKNRIAPAPATSEVEAADINIAPAIGESARAN